jgi:hypothetical protein
MNFEIKYFDKEKRRFLETTINTDDVTSYGITNTPMYYKNRSFRKYFKKGFINTNSNRYNVNEYFICELRKLLPNFKETKYYNEIMKKGSVRKSIDRHYNKIK